MTTILQLDSAPIASHPDVLVHAPRPLDPHKPVPVVVFMHGWYGCVRAIASDKDERCREGGVRRGSLDLVGQFDRAGVDALLVVPEVGVDERGSESGRMGEHGGLRRLLADVLAHPALLPVLGRSRGPHEIGRVVLSAHSGGYVPLAEVLEQGGVDVHEVHLHDACYDELPEIVQWGRRHAQQFVPGPLGRRVVMAYAANGGLGRTCRKMVDGIAKTLPEAQAAAVLYRASPDEPTSPATLAHPLLLLPVRASHRDVPREMFGPLVASAGLTRRAQGG